MKSIQNKLVGLAKGITGLMLLLFLGVGMAAAYISFTIQAEILSQIFKDSVISFTLLAACYEFGKIGLILISRLFSEYGKGIEGRIIKLSYRVIVAGSIICSASFCLWSLCDPAFDEKLKVGQAQIDTDFSKRERDTKIFYDDALTKELELVQDQIKHHRDLMDIERHITFAGTDNFEGKRYVLSFEEVKRLKSEIATVTTKYADLKDAELNQLREEKIRHINDLLKETQNLTISGNEVIIKILIMLNGGSRDFGQGIYVGFVLMLSLIFTGILESLIIVCFVFIAMLYGKDFSNYIHKQKFNSDQRTLFDAAEDTMKNSKENEDRIFDQYIKMKLAYARKITKEFIDIMKNISKPNSKNDEQKRRTKTEA